MHSSPRYHHIKQIILTEFTAHNVWKYSEQPLFITLKSNNLKSILVRAAHKPTEENRITITTTCQRPSNEPKHSLQRPQYKTTKTPKNAKNLAVQPVYTIMTLNTFKALQQRNSSKSDTHSRAIQTK